MSTLNATTVKTNTIQNTSGVSALSIDANGRVSKPNIPVFYAYRLGAADASENNKIFTTEFNSTMINNGGYYSGTTGRFTAPYAGTYFFGGKLLQRNNTRVEYTFYKNGTNASPGGRGMAYATSDNHGDMYAYIFLDLAAGVYVQIGTNGVSM